jgi:mannosylglycoprotein endo-beta-mannosidase
MEKNFLIFWFQLFCPGLICGFLAAAPANAAVLPLDSGWLLKSSQDLGDPGEQISTPAYPTSNWMKAQVPGTVLNSYVLNGIYPEPTYGLNNQVTFGQTGRVAGGLIPDASIPGSVFTYPFWFRTTFTLTSVDPAQVIWLNFSAINWGAVVFLNGHFIGNMKGAFTRGNFNISAAAKAGENILAVKIEPPPFPGTPSNNGCGGDTIFPSFGWTPATIYQSINWDCSIIDGVRDRAIGIYRPVTITTSGPVSVRNPFIFTQGVPTADEANLGFRTYVINNTASAQNGTLKLDSDGVSLSKSVSLAPQESKEVTFTSADTPGLKVAHPRLWWPVGRGDANLYSARISFVLPTGAVSDSIDTHFGIRSVEHELFHGQHVFKVNGHRMFLAGGAWLQDAMLRSTPERYEAQARLIARAGLNWIRCWSGSGPEADELFDACDKYGILVWVESGLTEQTRFPYQEPFFPEFIKCVNDNWQDTILRVRNHPSVFHYAGCNEAGDLPGMDQVVQQYDGTRLYQVNSQDFGQRGSPYRYLGIDCLYDYSGTDLFGAGPLGVFGGFCNESGNPCLPPIETLRGMMPADKLWPIDEASFNYHDGGGFHQVVKMVKEGCGAYGDFSQPDLAGRVGAENYAFKGQILGAMQYRADGELWQRNKWDATGKFATGWALWTVNNTFPEVCGRIFNYSLEPNASLFYLAHAQKPLHVQYDYHGNDVSAVNNSFADARSLHLKVEVHNLDWSLKWSATQDLPDLPEETTRNGLIAVPPKDSPGFDEVHFIEVELFDAANQKLDDMIYWRSKRDQKYGADGPFTALQSMPSTTLKIAAAVETRGDRQFVTAKIRNIGSNLAFFTRLKVYRQEAQQLVDGSFYSDNYLSISPGGETAVTIDYPVKSLRGENPVLIVEGWNLKTLSIPLVADGKL